MKDINNLIQTYNDMILDESFDFIIYEMLNDLKQELLKNTLGYDYEIYETFYNINKGSNISMELNNLSIKLTNEEILTEGLVSGMSKVLSKLKFGFSKKHKQIVERDDVWLRKNKKKILSLDYEQIELEVLSDYKVTFEGLLNRHNIFDKNFVNSENHANISEKIKRFEDKHDNLKNGLDNYFRTGTSRKEIGLRKLAGGEAKVAVENMIAYCESFLAGKKFLEEKLNQILVDINDNDVKESLSPIYVLREAIEDEEDFDESEFEEDDVENKADNSNNNERSIKDRQVGIAVLLTVAEARYFDYINILKGLAE